MSDIERFVLASFERGATGQREIVEGGGVVIGASSDLLSVPRCSGGVERSVAGASNHFPISS